MTRDVNWAPLELEQNTNESQLVIFYMELDIIGEEDSNPGIDLPRNLGRQEKEVGEERCDA